jgi:hypothetical protein
MLEPPDVAVDIDFSKLFETCRKKATALDLSEKS